MSPCAEPTTSRCQDRTDLSCCTCSMTACTAKRACARSGPGRNLALALHSSSTAGALRHTRDPRSATSMAWTSGRIAPDGRELMLCLLGLSSLRILELLQNFQAAAPQGSRNQAPCAVPGYEATSQRTLLHMLFLLFGLTWLFLNMEFSTC